MELLSEKTLKLTKEAVKELFPDFSSYEKLFIRPASDDNFGDFQTNFAMATAGDLRQNPRKTADMLAGKLSAHSMFSKVEAAGPGFINFYIAADFIKNILMELDHTRWDFSFLDRNGDIIIDYSSPNIAKPLHVGHLRSTIIGDSIKRINRFLGYSVIADNHIGDWGTQFGKLIYAWRHWCDQDEIKKNPMKEMQRLYELFSEKSREKPELIEEARKELVKLQKNDKETVKLWEMFTAISREDSEKIYKRLGVEFDTWHGESFYRSMMKDIVQDLTKKGVAREDDGAVVVFFEDKNLHPCIIQKKDGSFLYSTSEIATLKYKVEK
ncbi:MAG: arginine--tRNA ligase, partial [bacterium]